MNFITSYSSFRMLYSLADEGLANFLAIETLRHGTNPVNYVGISLFGGLPQHGGKSHGSTHEWTYDSDVFHYFYCFKDSHFYFHIPSSDFVSRLINNYPKGIPKRFFAKQHTFLSGYNFTARIISKHAADRSLLLSKLKIAVGVIGGLASSLITPTLRFHYSEIDAQKFEDDYKYNGAAYRTKEKVEAWRLGIVGSLITGVNLGLFSRIRARPLKFLTGVVQLTALVGLIILCCKPAVLTASIPLLDKVIQQPLIAEMASKVASVVNPILNIF